MEREVKQSKHSFDLIGIAGQRLRKNFWKCALGTFMYLLPIISFFCVGAVIGALFNLAWFFVACACISVGFICATTLGYTSYFKKAFYGEAVSIKELYCNYKFLPLSILIGITLIGMYFFSFLALIFPLVLAITYYSFVFYFIEDKKITKYRDAWKICRDNCKKNFSIIFGYKTLFYLLYLILFLVVLVVYLLINRYSVINTADTIILCICGFIAFTVIYTAITIYFSACNRVCYEEMVEANKNQDVKEVKKVVIKDEKTSEVTEAKLTISEPVANKKPATKKPVDTTAKAKADDKSKAKSTAKKTTSNKTTSNKPSSKKTTTKKTPKTTK